MASIPRRFSTFRRVGPPRVGLFEVAEGVPSGSDAAAHPALDVVAVHGLNGDAVGTWTHIDQQGNQTMWLKDLLPKKIQDARVLSFGYHATVVANTSVAGVRDNARLLLEMLRDKREDNPDPRRPIVFVGHSLGGIIIKQALRIANNEARYMGIAVSTAGVLFFGTPHRGASAAKWASLVTEIAAAVMVKTPSALLETLKPNSKDLMDISEDFRSIAEQYAIVSLYEEHVFRGMGSVVVEKHSAIMELPHEESMMMGGDHKSMCRFQAGDQRFDFVWRRIRRLANGRRDEWGAQGWRDGLSTSRRDSLIWQGP